MAFLAFVRFDFPYFCSLHSCALPCNYPLLCSVAPVVASPRSFACRCPMAVLVLLYNFGLLCPAVFSQWAIVILHRRAWPQRFFDYFHGAATGLVSSFVRCLFFCLLKLLPWPCPDFFPWRCPMSFHDFAGGMIVLPASCIALLFGVCN